MLTIIIQLMQYEFYYAKANIVQLVNIEVDDTDIK